MAGLKSQLLVGAESLIQLVLCRIEKGCRDRGIPATSIRLGYDGNEWHASYFFPATGERNVTTFPCLWSIYDALGDHTSSHVRSLSRPQSSDSRSPGNTEENHGS